MHIHPLLESLASLETTCREAVECLHVLTWRSVGPEFGSLRQLRELFGGDGCSGHRETIRQLSGVVGHCMNRESDGQNYRFEIIMRQSDDGDGNFTDDDEPYIEGSTPHEIRARNAVDALLKLLDDSQGSLNSAIAKVTGGGLIEIFTMRNNGLALVDNAWQRLRDHWHNVLESVALPVGLDVSGFLDVVSEEIKAAKHLLTFETPLPGAKGTTAESEQVEPTPKPKGRPRKTDLKEAEILRVHKDGQSHAETAAIANVKTADGYPDARRVTRVLNAYKQRKRRKRSTK